jgi:hypothetical protein
VRHALDAVCWSIADLRLPVVMMDLIKVLQTKRPIAHYCRIVS